MSNEVFLFNNIVVGLYAIIMPIVIKDIFGRGYKLIIIITEAKKHNIIINSDKSCIHVCV